MNKRDSALLLLTPLCTCCHSAGARAPTGRPDEWDPGRQELLAQQDSGLSEELCLLFLKLLVPDPILSKGGSCLDGPPPISLSPAGFTLKPRNTDWKVQYSFFSWWQSRATWSSLGRKQQTKWQKKQARVSTSHLCVTWCLYLRERKSDCWPSLLDRWQWTISEA